MIISEMAIAMQKYTFFLIQPKKKQKISHLIILTFKTDYRGYWSGCP